MHIVSQILLDWYEQNKRDLPWRNITDPYRIWLSEVILQQTRVAQGMDYYLKFVDAFPTVHHLANADEDAVLKLWQGLGYYSRARNLHTTAKIIATQQGGVFPASYKSLLALPGVGRYTAAAIASFAFLLPSPVLDGNVFRVIARLFAIDAPIDVQANLKIFDHILLQLIEHTNPSVFNQSIMEFGALQCVPQIPKCDQCPLMHHCLAYQYGCVSTLPVKLKKIVQRKRFFNYIFIISNHKTYIKQRQSKDIWQNLYEPVLYETMEEVSVSEFENSLFFKHLFEPYSYKLLTIGKLKHQLTHQQILSQMVVVSIDDNRFVAEDYIEINIVDIFDYPVPRLVDLYLHDLQSKGLMNNL